MIYGLLFARTAIPWSLRHATVWICRATRSFIIDIDLWGDVSFFSCFFQEWDTSSNCRSFAGLFGHRAWHESHGDRLGTDRPWWPCFRAHMFFYSTSNRAKMPLKYGELIDRGKGNDNEWHEDSRWSCRRNVAEVTFSWLWVLLTMMMMWICRQL